MVMPIRLDDELSPSVSQERRHFSITLKYLRSSTKAGWEKLTGVLDAALMCLADSPELSAELSECLQRDTWLPVLFIIAFQCTFMLAPWSNSFLSDVWGDERIAIYFKVGLMAGAWQVICLGVAPAFTPYWPLPWMPIIAGATMSPAFGMTYYNVPRDKRSAACRKKIAMVFVTLGGGVAVFGISYPVLYYLSLELNGLLKICFFLVFYVFRKVFENVAKHYARMFCIDCYPMIVLFGMYAYEFFISSAISDVPEVWLAMLLIALDLAENFFHIYCIYRAGDPSSSLGGVSRVSLQDPKPDSQRVEGDNEGQPDETAPAPLPPTDHEHPANDSQTSDSHPNGEIEPPLPQSPALETGFRLSAPDKRSGGATADRGANSAKTHLDALQCPGRIEPDVLYGRGGSHLNTLESSSDAQCSDFLRIMPSIDGSATVNSDHGSATAGRKREIAARLSYFNARRGIDRRGSSMSTLSSFTSLLKHTIGYARQGLVEGTLDGVSLASDGNGLVKGPFPIDGAQTIVRRASHEGSLPSRRSSVLEIITEVIIGRSKGKLAEKCSKRSLSVMAIAICEEMVEILAPLHFLISSRVLRTFNPKLHDTFWDMTDKEFARSIRRLLIDIVAEACLFILFIIAMKRRFDESIVFIALRLGYHFLWPFLTVQVSLMTYYILLQYSNAGMTFSGDFIWVGEKNVTWHGGNCYTRGSEIVDEVC